MLASLYMSEAILLNDQRYPKLLKGVPNPPQELFFKGRFDSSLFENCVGVVGSRRTTSYGKKAAEYFVENLCRYEITIVSGFMYGIDSAAHDACINSRGRTLAILPYGIDYPCPQYQKDLYEQIVDSGGLIISEYAGNFPPAKWTFPKRNRIIAGLCRALVVVEAGKGSGSLITAEFAYKYGRQVFAVPGSIFSENFEGLLGLLESSKARVASVKGLIEFLGINYEHLDRSELPKSPVPGSWKRVLQSLSEQSRSFDEILSSTGLNNRLLSTILMQLEIERRIFSEGGKYHFSKN
jgi:DNA processing protein